VPRQTDASAALNPLRLNGTDANEVEPYLQLNERGSFENRSNVRVRAGEGIDMKT
jgi:hypothetical protein